MTEHANIALVSFFKLSVGDHWSYMASIMHDHHCVFLEDDALVVLRALQEVWRELEGWDKTTCSSENSLSIWLEANNS